MVAGTASLLFFVVDSFMLTSVVVVICRCFVVLSRARVNPHHQMHKHQLQLYAQYQPDGLLKFMRTSSYISLKEALEVCEKNAYHNAAASTAALMSSPVSGGLCYWTSQCVCVVLSRVL